MYLFKQDIHYDPNGKFYPAGKKDALKDWQKQHIQDALAADQIEDLEQPKNLSEDRGKIEESSSKEE